MKVVIAIDSFKGSLSTFESGCAVSDALRMVAPTAEAVICPLADGGEGTVNAIVSATGGKLCKVRVCGPLGDPVTAEYGVIPETRTAVIEMASAAGITLIAPDERNPLRTTTRGVGEMILHAIEYSDCRDFIIGIGGSATNDGGVGMLKALGFSFLDANGAEIDDGARGLADLAEIRCDGAHPALAECHFHIACDVTNPLCGAHGCSAIYGPQKGATPEMVADMDAWLASYAKLTAQATGRDCAEVAGVGAAGGLGFAFLAYLCGKLESGIELVMRATDLEAKIKDADVVVTGEGRLDGQSCMGKAPIGVARLAKKHAKPVLAFAGCVTEDARACNDHGIDAFFPILRTPCSLEEAMRIETAYRNLKNTAEQAFRLMLVCQSER